MPETRLLRVMLRRHARIVLRQLRISDQCASLRATSSNFSGSKSKFNHWGGATHRKIMGDRAALGGVIDYEGLGGGEINFELVAMDNNWAHNGAIVDVYSPELFNQVEGMKITMRKAALRGNGAEEAGAGFYVCNVWPAQVLIEDVFLAEPLSQFAGLVGVFWFPGFRATKKKTHGHTSLVVRRVHTRNVTTVLSGLVSVYGSSSTLYTLSQCHVMPVQIFESYYTRARTCMRTHTCTSTRTRRDNDSDLRWSSTAQKSENDINIGNNCV